ncbi:hypothetical protein ABPG72_018656 [Tetrahymena utriculariae]
MINSLQAILLTLASIDLLPKFSLEARQCLKRDVIHQEVYNYYLIGLRENIEKEKLNFIYNKLNYQMIDTVQQQYEDKVKLLQQYYDLDYKKSTINDGQIQFYSVLTYFQG